MGGLKGVREGWEWESESVSECGSVSGSGAGASLRLHLGGWEGFQGHRGINTGSNN